MSRVQLALNVSNLDKAVDFYSKLFRVESVKRRPGYANFAITEPPLKLVLIESEDAPGTLNHLGVEVFSTEEVVAETRRFAEAGLATRIEDGVECCYARQDKVWVAGPDSEPWEIYAVLGDADMSAGKLRVDAEDGGSACCTSTSDDAVAPVSVCC